MESPPWQPYTRSLRPAKGNPDDKNTTKLEEFYKKAFGGKISFVTLLLAALITLCATLGTVLIVSLVQKKAFSSYWSLGAYPFWASFLFSVTTGPTGEESG